MPWYFPWSESIKKRACRYLLQHYLGDFLKEKLTLNQLTVDLYNGKGIVKNVPLDVWALNEMLDNFGIPLELIDGFIGSISVLVPWTTLLSDSCEVEINGLELTLAPKQRGEQANMFDSNISWSSMSMTTSIQLAQECLKQDPSPGEEQAESAQTFEGLEAFAQTIESVLSRIKLMFNNTVIRLEHIPADSSSGIGLELHLERVRYFDSSNQELGSNESSQHTVYEPVAIAIKNFHIHGVQLYMDEFPVQKRTRLKEATESKKAFGVDGSPPTLLSLTSDKEHSRPAFAHSDSILLPPLQILGSSGKQTVKMKLKQNDAIPGPKIDLEYFFGALNILLTPRQVHLLLDVISNVPSSSPPNDSNVKGTPQKARMRMMGHEDYQRVEQALQQQFVGAPVTLLSRQDSWQTAMENASPESRHRVIRSGSKDSDGDEFYSMNDFSLPALGQPPVTFVSASSEGTESGTYHSGMSSLANVSLGSGSFLLGSNSTVKSGSLTERASSVFKAPDTALGKEDGGKLNSKGSFSHSSNSGLAGISALDDTADLTHVRFRSSNVILVLLHQEPLHTSERTKLDHETSSEPTLVELSEGFFKGVVRYSLQGLFGSSAKDVRDGLSSLCPFDHTRFLLSAVTAECESKLLSGGNSLTLDLILGKVVADEFLFEKGKRKQAFMTPYSQTKLLHFAMDEDNPLCPGGFGTTPGPCLKLKMEKTSRSKSLSTGVQSRSSPHPKSQVTIDVSKVAMELDLTIIDRIAGLIWPGPLYQQSEPNMQSNKMFSSLLSTVNMNRQATCFHQIIDEGPGGPPEIKTEVELRCPSFSVNLRFPVPDLRPASDIEKRPWWRKAVRTECLLLEFTNFEFRTSMSPVMSVSSYESRFKSCSGYFQTKGEELLHILEIGCLSAEESNTFGVDYPRVTVSLCPPCSRSVFEDADNEPKSSGSQFDSLEENWLKSEPSPFSARPAMYEREELVMPGNVAEMNAFEISASLNALLQIDCFFPHLKANLLTKDVFELFYNRIFNDLLMWEPSAPSPIDSLSKSHFPPHGSIHINLASQVGLGGGDKFFMCRSAAREVFDDSDDDTNSYMSNDFIGASGKTASQMQQSNSSVSISITKGELALFPEMKPGNNSDDDTIEESSESSIGHMIINVRDARLFVVSGYKGQPTLSYTQLYAMDACLYHRSNVDETIDIEVMSEALSTSTLARTIYRSDSSVLNRSREGSAVLGENAPVLSLSIKSTIEESSKHRDNLVAVGLRGATMSYVVLNSGESWLSQVMEFLDVQDYPVLGYTPFSVITVLHTHFWGCSVDYRAVYLPTKVLLLVEAFSISSNIVPKSSASILRFLVEDSSLYLSEKTCSEVNLDADYVCVMDMELFELALRVTDGTDMRQPKLDLTMSNNILYIRTCSDSCLALVKLIKYFAKDGDLEEPSLLTPEAEHDSGSLESLSVQSPQPKISVDENEMNSLIGDAMKESKSSLGSQNSSSMDLDDIQRLKLFNTSPVKGAMIYGDDDSEDYLSSGDEYCILESDKDGESEEEAEPTVRKLSDKPISIVDDYFSILLCRNDQMTPPSHFPTPEYRYTIRELSVVWQMYGGRDFVPSFEASSPLQSSGSWPESYTATNHYSNERKHEQAYHTSDFSRSGRVYLPDANNTYRRANTKCQGGVHRNLETLMELQMNKIRYQHDVYPEGADQISRDVLLIHDLEVRDRLSKSQINKFLYRFTSEEYPKQTNANMVTLKLLITKPEDDVRAQEASLRVSLQPLRLNIDQDSLFFLKTFFTELSDDSPTKRPRVSSLTEGRVVGGASPQTDPMKYFDHEFTDEDHFSRASTATPSSKESRTVQDDSSSLFFRSFVFSPEVPIRLDYHGKHIDMDQGTFAGLLIGLAHLNCSELKLKRLCCRSGLLGPERILAYCIHEWLMDIRKTQIPSILGGVGPAHSIVQLFQGLKDLFWMPVQQYKQDGRIVRGLQRGAHSFSTSTAMAVLELSNRVVMVIQSAAETAFDMVSPGPSVSNPNNQRRLHGRQPADLREGVTNAYDVITKGISETTAAIVKVATEEHDKKGVSGAVGGVIRQIPPTVLQPIILATEATSNVLGGARNQLAPDARREAAEKWKAPNQ